MFYVYKITNSINGKSYIGSTTNLKKRWGAHKSSAKEKSNAYPMYKEMRKHGLSNFFIDIVDICKSGNQRDVEAYWIQKLNSLTPRGYNINNANSEYYCKKGPKGHIYHTEIAKIIGAIMYDFDIPFLTIEKKTKITAPEMRQIASGEANHAIDNMFKLLEFLGYRIKIEKI